MTNYNVAIEQYAEAEVKGDVAKMIALQPAIKFNGGGAPAKQEHSSVPRTVSEASPVPNPTGHVNHSIFWKNLCPSKVRYSRLDPFHRGKLLSDVLNSPQDYAPPSGELLKYIEKDFGSLDALIKKFSGSAVGVQGSGWGVRGALPL